jgi:hypothetical protein
MNLSLKPKERQSLPANDVLRISIGVILFLMITSGMLYYLLRINLLKHLPQISICPFHAVTGLLCPGCGMTRAFISIAQLKLKDAIYFNPFSIPLLSVMVIYLCYGKTPLWLQSRGLGCASVIIVLVFWIIRLIHT